MDQVDQVGRIDYEALAEVPPAALAALPGEGDRLLKTGNVRMRFANDQVLIGLAEAMIQTAVEIEAVEDAVDQTAEVAQEARESARRNPPSSSQMMGKTDR